MSRHFVPAPTFPLPTILPRRWKMIALSNSPSTNPVTCVSSHNSFPFMRKIIAVRCSIPIPWLFFARSNENGISPCCCCQNFPFRLDSDSVTSCDLVWLRLRRSRTRRCDKFRWFDTFVVLAKWFIVTITLISEFGYLVWLFLVWHRL